MKTFGLFIKLLAIHASVSAIQYHMEFKFACLLAYFHVSGANLQTRIVSVHSFFVEKKS